MSSPISRAVFAGRHRAILQAVVTGRAEVLCGRVPNLLVDGRFCDHAATHDLFLAGLVTADAGPLGRRVTAHVTEDGRRMLGAAR